MRLALKTHRLRKGAIYSIQGVERDTFYDVILNPNVVQGYIHDDIDDTHVEVVLITNTYVTLNPLVACAIIKKAGIATVSSLKEICAVAAQPVQVDYPEESKYRPIPYGNYPFPDEKGDWAPVDDWTEAEIRTAAFHEADKGLVIVEDGKTYLCLNPM